MKDGDRLIQELQLRELERLQEMVNRAQSKVRLLCAALYKVNAYRYPDQPVEDKGIRN